jgi:hypothetical protein
MPKPAAALGGPARKCGAPEADLQRSVVHHSANEVSGGGPTARRRQGILEGMGVHAGFADLIVLSEGRVLFLELKSKHGALRVGQAEFRDRGKRCCDPTRTGPAPIAEEGVTLIRDLYAIEADIRGSDPTTRLAIRQERSGLILARIDDWLADHRARASANENGSAKVCHGSGVIISLRAT